MITKQGEIYQAFIYTSILLMPHSEALIPRSYSYALQHNKVMREILAVLFAPKLCMWSVACT